MRFAADLVEAATAEGKRDNRSAKQTLDHWARVGRSVSAYETSARRRVEEALSGSRPLTELSAEERRVADAEVAAAIEERAASVAFGRALLTHGVTAVALDEDGRLTRYHPDGTTSPVD